jgi:HK97 family phage major capsid protein
VSDENKTLSEVNDNLNGFIAESQKSLDEFKKGYIHKDTLDATLKKIDEHFADLETKITRPGAGGEAKDERGAIEKKAFGNWLRKGMKDLSPDERKVLTIADSDHAGVLATSDFRNEIIKKATIFSPIRSIARVITTSNYEVDIPYELAVPSMSVAAESAEKTETTGYTFGLRTIPTFEGYALFKATQKMIEDSAFPIEAEIANVIGRRKGVWEGTQFVVGDGTTEPEGFTINADVVSNTYSTASSNVVAVGDLLGTQYALKSPYVANASWVMNRSMVAKILSLVNATTNAYYLIPDWTKGQPARLLGSPIYECPDMAAGSLTPADGVITMAYGDFAQGYCIVDRVDLTIQRLVEKYAEFGMIGFLARWRVGGQAILPEAIVLCTTTA